MSRAVVVTGGAGFIGRNVVAALNARGETQIIVVDHLGTTEKWRNLRGLQFDDFFEKDVFRDLVRTDRLPGIRAVIHLGACSSTTETDASYLMDNNYRVTRELCEWCLTHGARFVYASSAATYGDGRHGYSDDDRVTPRLEPLNMYGYSKHCFDQWALRKGLFSMIAGLKYFNVYGPHETHKGAMRSMVHKAFGQIMAGGTVQLFKSHHPDYADGEQVRDFVYVRDAVAMTCHLLDHPETSGLFNCGTGTARSWNDLAKAVFAALNREPRITYIDMPVELRARYQYHTLADNRKTRQAGYRSPFISLEEGVRDYVTTYLLPQQEMETHG